MIAIIGCGTLGSRTAHELEDHELLLVDHDAVREENLSAQNYAESDVGAAKARALAAQLENATPQPSFIDHNTLELLRQAETVIDCTDNLLTRRILSRWCVENGVPLVHAAAGKTRGVAALFTKQPCLECVYDGKVPVEACRGSEIDMDVADRLAHRQAALARNALAGETDDTLYLITADEETTATIPQQSCTQCAGTPQPLTTSFYITHCTRTGCLTAKPHAKKDVRKGVYEKDGVTAQVLPSGEIAFTGSEDLDALYAFAEQLYDALATS